VCDITKKPRTVKVRECATVQSECHQEAAHGQGFARLTGAALLTLPLSHKVLHYCGGTGGALEISHFKVTGPLLLAHFKVRSSGSEAVVEKQW
jgi:hypothetical protein